MPKTQQRHEGGDKGLEHDERADAVDPHHGGGRVADHAARAAGIGGGDDGGEVADVHLAREDLPRASCRRSAPRRCCRGSSTPRTRSRAAAKAPFQSSGRKRGIASGTRLFSKWRESSAKPISSRNRLERIDPLVRHVHGRGRQARAFLEAGEAQLVGGDGGKAGQRDLQRVVVEQRDAQQRQCEQDEIERECRRREWVRTQGPRVLSNGTDITGAWWMSLRC